jgi:hypothetical protein
MIPRESADVVAEAVAAILDAARPGLPEPIAEVERIRSAVRRILDANLSLEAEQRLLAGFLPVIKGCAVPEWASDVFLRETEPTCSVPSPRTMSWAERQRRLRRVGYQLCPCCGGHIVTEDDLERLVTRQQPEVAR